MGFKNHILLRFSQVMLLLLLVLSLSLSIFLDTRMTTNLRAIESYAFDEQIEGSLSESELSVLTALTNNINAMRWQTSALIGGSFGSLYLMLILIAWRVSRVIRRQRLSIQASEGRYQDLFDNASELIQSVTPDGAFIYVNRAWTDTLGYSNEEVQALNVFDVIHKDSLDSYQAIYQGLAPGQSSERIEVEFIAKNGEAVYAEGNINCAFENDELVSTRGIFQDVTQRYNSEKALALAAESASYLLEQNVAIGEIGRLANSSPDLEAVYGQLAERILRLVGADGLGLEITDESNDCVVTVHGFSTGRLAPGLAQVVTSPLLGSPTERIVNTGTGFYLELRDDDDFTGGYPGLLALREAGSRSYMGVPLISKGRAFGALHLLSQLPNSFSEEGLPLAQRVADQISGAITNDQLRRHLQLASDSLSRSQEKYGQMAALIMDVVYEVDAEGLFTYVNSMGPRVTGFSVEETLGRHFTEFVHSDYRDEVRQFYQEQLNDRRPESLVEFPIVTKTDEVRLMEQRVRLMTDDGHVTGFQVVARDITERKETEERAQKTEDRFRSLVEHAVNGFLAVDSVGKVVDVNGWFSDNLGYTREEMLDMSMTDFVAAFQVERLTLAWERAAQGGSFTVQDLFLRKDGSQFPVELGVGLLEMEGSECLFATVRDVTERLQTSEALKYANEQLSLVVENVPIITYVSETGGDFGETYFVSPAAYGITGYQPEDFTGNPTFWADHIHPDDRDAVFAKLPALFEGDRHHREYRWRIADGSYRWFGDFLRLTRDKEGSPSHIVGAWVDITERKQIEARLQQAQGEAEQADAAKNELLANMSHEIRVQMSGIIDISKLALGTDLAPDQQEYVSMVNRSAVTLLKVVDDIIDFSNIDAGGLGLEATEFDLRDCVSDALQVVALRAHEKDLELVQHIDGRVPARLSGDPVRLRQVIVNLVDNASKFTEQGEVVVAVTVESNDDDGTKLHFSVRDTGIGIAPDERQAILSSFSRTGSATDGEQEAFGQGLKVCSELVRLMRGDIWLDSEVGSGSTFHFTAEFGRAPEAETAADSGPTPDLQGVPVLLVDDNTTNLATVHQMVADWGMEPLPATNAEQAIETLSRAVADGREVRLAVLDGNLAGEDGFSLLRRIRAEIAPEISGVMMLATSHQMEDITRCIEVGATGHILKPVSQSSLLEAVAAAINSGEGPGTEAPETSDATETPPNRPTGLRILVAEDNDVNQRLAVRLLESREHVVTAVSDGQAVLDALSAEEFDCVLMDVEMPVLDGPDTTKIIRQNEADGNKHMPIIAMTASATDDEEELCLGAGMDGYLAKPLALQPLQEALDRLVEGPEAGEEQLAVQEQEAFQVSAAEPETETTSDVSSEMRDSQPAAQPQESDGETAYIESAEAESDLGPPVAPDEFAPSSEQSSEAIEKVPPDEETKAGPDIGAAVRRFGNDTLFTEMAKQFLANYPAVMLNMYEAIEDEDHGSVRLLARSLKDLLGMFGADSAYNLSLRLEMMAHAGDVTQARPVFDELEREMLLLSHAIKRAVTLETG